MKKIFTIIFLLSVFSVWGQNLVLNPSFEDVNVNCSGFTGAGYTNIISWDNPDPTDTCSTPDWFSTCLSSFFPTAAPNSWLGSQNARTGNAYAGFILYDVTTNSYREYVEGTLSSPLSAGQTYCVSFYLSLADTVPYAVSDIGVYFSPTFVQFPVSHCDNTVPLPVTPQLVYTGNTLDDTDNWVRLEWQYTATGGEQYFVIGNFDNNANTSVVNTGASGFTTPFAYYFIDDVSVSAGVCCDAGILPVADFCPNANPSNLIANTGGGTWSGTGITDAAAGTFDPTVAGLGSYTITYTLPCGATDTVNVTVKNCIEVCIDGSGNLTASGGTAPYSWQQGTLTQDCSACLIGCIFPPGCAVNVTTWNTFATGTTIALPAAFPIQVVDANGQTVTVSDTANLPPCACSFNLAVATNTPASCGNANGSVTINANGGASPYIYSWNNGQTSATASNLLAGNYTCTATDANGCLSTLAVTVTNNTPIVANITVTNVACANDKTGSLAVAVSNGVAPYTFSWNTGQTSQTLNNMQAGSYICFIHDATGCATSVSGTISQPPVLVLNASSTPNTSGNNGTASVNVSGGTPPYTYTWQTSPLQYTQTITGLSNGIYTCVVHDASGCAKNVSVVISETGVLDGKQTGIQYFSISPNPSQGEFTLNVQLHQPEAIVVSLQDVLGREIWKGQSEVTSQYLKEFSLNYLDKGVYFLVVSTRKGTVREKIVLE